MRGFQAAFLQHGWGNINPYVAAIRIGLQDLPECNACARRNFQYRFAIFDVGQLQRLPACAGLGQAASKIIDRRDAGIDFNNIIFLEKCFC